MSFIDVAEKPLSMNRRVASSRNTLFDGAPAGTVAYVCGPAGQMDDVRERGAKVGVTVHSEDFGESADDVPFVVVLA